MANEIVNRQINIFIQSGDAQRALDALVKKEQQLKDALAKATDPKEIQKLQTELTRISEPIDRAKKKLSGELQPTFKDLEFSTRKWLNEFKRTGDPAALANFQKFNTALQEHKKVINGVKEAHESLTHGTIFSGVFWANLAVNGIERAGHALKEFFVGGIEEAVQEEVTISKLQNILENLGRSDLFGPLILSAEKLSKEFKTIKPDEIVGVFQQLITYGKLSENQINKLTPVIIDFARKSGNTLQEATSIILKALEGNSRALKEYGINVKEGGNATQRFSILMNELGPRVRGAEAAFERTNAGGWQKFKTFLSEAKQKVGEFILSLTGLEKRQQENAVQSKKDADQGQILVTRYEELSKKVNQTTSEKAELKNITSELGIIFGNSVLQINKETGALELNLTATKDLIKQKLLLANSRAAELASKINALEEDQVARNERIATQTRVNIDLQKKYGISVEEVLHLAAGTDAQKRRVLDDENLKKINAQGIAFFELKEQSAKADKEINKLSKDLNELGFKKEDVDKLFKPQNPNAAVNPNDTPDDGGKGKFEELLNQAESFNKKIRDLQLQAEKANKTQNQKEIDDAKHKYDEILIEYNKLKAQLDKAGIKLKFDISDIIKLEDKELAGIIQKQVLKTQTQTEEKFIETTKQTVTQTIAKTEEFFTEKKQIESQRFAEGIIDKKTYENNIVALDSKSKEQQLKITEQFLTAIKEEQRTAISNAVNIFDEEKLQAKKSLEEGTITREEFEQTIVNIDNKSKEQQLVIEKVFSSTVERFAANVTTAKKAQLDKQVQDELIAFEKKKENQKLLKSLDDQAVIASAQTRVALAGKGTDEELNAKKALLELEHQLELEALEQKRQDALRELNDEFDDELRIFKQRAELERQLQLLKVDPNDPEAEQKKKEINNRFDFSIVQAEIDTQAKKAEAIIKINDDFNKIIAATNALFRKHEGELDEQNWKERVNHRLEQAQEILNLFSLVSQAMSDKENAELDADKRRNDVKRANLERRLKAGVITQLQYNRELEKIDHDQQRKEKEAKKKQFERNKASQLIQGAISGAQAVIKTLEEFGPPVPPNFLGIAAMTFTVAATIAQEALIAKQKAPEFAKGGKLGGSYHSQGGNPIVDSRTGKKIAEIEKDEGIINRRSMADKKVYTVTGTPSQIASSINGLYGIHWEKGGKIIPVWRTARPTPINFEKVRKYYALGGKFAGGGVITQKADTSNQHADSAVLKELTAAIIDLKQSNADMHSTISELQNTLSKGIKAKANIVLTDLEDEQDRLAAIRDDATMKG